MKIFVIGSINMDLVIHTDKIPNLGETITGSKFETHPGGKGANQAIAISKMGHSVSMVGVIGNTFNKELISSFETEKVITDHIRFDQDISSGVAIIMVTN